MFIWLRRFLHSCIFHAGSSITSGSETCCAAWKADKFLIQKCGSLQYWEYYLLQWILISDMLAIWLSKNSSISISVFSFISQYSASKTKQSQHWLQRWKMKTMLSNEYQKRHLAANITPNDKRSPPSFYCRTAIGQKIIRWSWHYSDFRLCSTNKNLESWGRRKK